VKSRDKNHDKVTRSGKGREEESDFEWLADESGDENDDSDEDYIPSSPGRR
jgi:hypothetical protein